MIKNISLPLYPDQDYQYSVALEGQSYRLRFTYNSVMKLYTIQISDEDQVTLISGVALVPNYPILADFKVAKLTGNFLLYSKSDKTFESYKAYPDKIHQYYELSYIYAIPD